MKKDIEFPLVEGVKVAIVKTINALSYPEWNAYIINRRAETLKNVLVSSKGYGEVNGEIIKTSVLRHVLGDLLPTQYALIEAIDPAVFKISNEFWVSFYIDQKIYDKKYIFLPETIIETNLIFIPELAAEGVLHV
ncbi:MAG: hypothetical protein RL060_137 [Bacteroidota bacterium]|jgi:hypothetical protein